MPHDIAVALTDADPKWCANASRCCGPPLYADVTREQLTAALKPPGVGTGQV